MQLEEEWTDEPETLTVARVEFNGGIGNARVILSNGMELGNIKYVETRATVDDVTVAGLVVRVG